MVGFKKIVVATDRGELPYTPHLTEKIIMKNKPILQCANENF